jgi:predicted RecA/RadA family phage recombinase
MATEVTLILEDERKKHTVSGAAVTCGEVVVNGGKVGVVETLTGGAVGEEVMLKVKGVAFLPAASATTFADGAVVQFNTTTRLCVATGGTHAGKAFYPKAAGELGVWVELNVPAAA